MTVRTLTVDDLDWAVTALVRRRRRLTPGAPVFWRPAPDAARRHRAYLEQLLVAAGASGLRTEQSLLIAAPHEAGWLVDDAAVAGEGWHGGDGSRLWRALRDRHAGATVRLVCPTAERERGDFARSAGLRRAETWWLDELDAGGGEAGTEVHLPGGRARTVAAPAIYAPPGPVLLIDEVEDLKRVVSAARDVAVAIGCAAVVVSHLGEERAAAALAGAGFRAHCDFFTGVL